MSEQNNLKVTLAGAAGGIGQPLALLLKQNPYITQLALYDIRGVRGVVADLNHLDTSPIVTAYEGEYEVAEAFRHADLIVISAGLPRQIDMISRNELFKKNAELVRELAFEAAKNSPKSMIAVITNPINSLVPLIRATLEKGGHRRPNNVFGITSIDLVRASTFLARLNNLNPSTVKVPVIGGHSDGTIIPLFSQATPGNIQITLEQAKDLTVRLTGAGTEVFKAKAVDTGGTATLSVAYAAAGFCSSILRALKGENNVTDTAYVRSSLVPGLTYFASPLLLGKNGVEKYLDFGQLNDYEQSLLKEAIPILKKEINEGEQFVGVENNT